MSYRDLTATNITDASTQDLGVTYEDGDYTERTVIVRGTVTETGREISAVVLIDSDGQSMPSPESFEVDGAWNFERAAADAAEGHDYAASLAGLIEADCRTIAEQVDV